MTPYSQISKIIYPVGSFYTSENSTNPSTLFGGTWELVKEYTGGELIAHGEAWNSKTGDVAKDADVMFNFSDLSSIIASHNIVSAIDDILSFSSGAFICKPKGIVGLVEADISYGYFNNYGNDNEGTIWWHENGNKLPDGVNLYGDEVLGTLTPPKMYGGASNKYFYEISDKFLNTESFFINPKASSYRTNLAIGNGGVRCMLLVKLYARNGKNYVWKRKA